MSAAPASYLMLPNLLLGEDCRHGGVLRISADVGTLSGFRRWVQGDAFPEKLKAHFIQGNVFLDLSHDTLLQIPPDVHTLAGFRRWVHSDEFPEKLRTHFIGGTVHVDMSEESIQSHVFVKVGVFATLIPLMREEDLGEFYTDGILLTNKKAGVSNNPDGLAALWKTIESGQVRFLLRKGKEREIQGTPDWVMEIVSDSSVAKDTRQLRKAYHKAGISEYWLIDACGEEVKFQILCRRKPRYVAAPVKDGWQRSRVFGRDFRLLRQRNRRGAWTYVLELK